MINATITPKDIVELGESNWVEIKTDKGEPISLHLYSGD